MAQISQQNSVAVSSISKLNLLIDALYQMNQSKMLSNKSFYSNQKAEQIQIQILTTLFGYQEGVQFVKEIDYIYEKLPQFFVRPLLLYIYFDSQFIDKHKKSLLGYLKQHFNKVLINGSQPIESLNKKKLIIEILFKAKYDQQKSILQQIIESSCRSDMQYCYNLLWNINEILEQSFSLNEITETFNFNHITSLCLRIINSISFASYVLINQSFRFISNIFLPIALSKAKIHSQYMSQVKQIILLITKKIDACNQEKKSEILQKVGNIYNFYGFFIQHVHDIFEREQEILMITQIVKLNSNIFMILFPNFRYSQEPHQKQKYNEKNFILFNQIEKLTQHFSVKNKHIITELSQQERKDHQKQLNQQKQDNLKNFQELKLRLSVLRGVSTFINKLFYWILNQQANIMDNQNFINQMVVFKTVFENLIICNDKQIFKNFFEIFMIKDRINQRLNINMQFSQQLIINRLINNCPSSQQINSSNLFDSNSILPQSIHKYLLELFNTNPFIHLSLIRQIKAQITLQYDKAFNQREFNSACSLLIEIIKLSKQLKIQNKEILSKDQLIEWIKTLMNLNQSCMVEFRKSIIDKTFQIIYFSFQMILPSNHYLQQIIQDKLIEFYPEKSMILRKLIEYYESNSQEVFERGYYNKYDRKQIMKEIQLIEGQGYFEKSTKCIEGGDNAVITHTYVRKLKLINKISEKLINQRFIGFKERIQLWKLIFRVYLIKDQSSLEKNLIFDKIKKTLTDRNTDILAKFIAAKEIDENLIPKINLSKEKLIEIKRSMELWTLFYSEELKYLKIIGQ